MENLRWKYINGNSKLLPRFIGIVILAVVFIIYFHSILQGRFDFGQADPSSRFLIAMDYAHNLRNALDLNAWFSVWPPVPFIIQGLILRLLLLLGLRDAGPYIYAVQITGVTLVLLGMYFIGRTVALQTNELTGLLASIFCLSAGTLLYLAPSSMAEVYAFFFISLAIFNMFRAIKYGKGLGWCIFFFLLAFFCRIESSLLAFTAAVYLFAIRRWRPAVLLLVIMLTALLVKLLGSLFLINGIKFFQYNSSLYGWNGKDAAKNALALITQLWFYNQKFILLSCLSLLSIAYYLFKHRKFSLDFTGNFRNNTHDTSTKNPFISYLTRILDGISSSAAKFPIIFWILMFMVAIGVLVGLALRGNINAQWHYLYIGNIFMTTVVAIMAAGSIKIVSAGQDRLAKVAVFGSTILLVLYSLWSGFSYATARKVQWPMAPMSPAMKGVVLYIREHSAPGDRVAFDFLLWQETPLEIQLLDPSQPTKIESETGLAPLVPNTMKAPDIWIAYMHAFIHVKHPKFLVIASPKLWEDIQKRSVNERDLDPNIPIDQIRGYLTPAKGSGNEFIFQSPYVFPDKKIIFDKVYENESYVVMERQGIQ